MKVVNGSENPASSTCGMEPVRETFQTDELAIVLSHYDLGILESITEFPRGSRKHPKLGLVTEKGKFLLKRRSLQRSHAQYSDIAHELQSYLIVEGFPLPRLITTRKGMTALKLRDSLYEIFEFVAGHSFRRALLETHDAGRTLARFHNYTSDWVGREEWRSGDYHDSVSVRTGLNRIPSVICEHASVVGKESELFGVTQVLFDQYEAAAREVEQTGYSRLSMNVIHCDWHPGNMLFKKNAVVAVIDYDNLRLGRRVIDIANGMLQFSMVGSGDPQTWPDHLEEEHMSAFLHGYSTVCRPEEAEFRSLLPLMIESLVAECVPPIMATGAFGPWQGLRFMGMVARKIQWMRSQQRRLLENFTKV